VITIPDYTTVISNIKYLIAIFPPQIDAITVSHDPSDANYLNKLITGLQSNINAIAIPDYTSDISSINPRILLVEDQINSLIIPPDYASDFNRLNNRITEMNQEIAKLHDQIRDGMDTNLMYINNSIANLRSQIDNINNPNLIITRVSACETYYLNTKIYIGNTVTYFNSRII
jgi:hypothetical protein